jgi:hypothetical protein
MHSETRQQQKEKPPRTQPLDPFKLCFRCNTMVTTDTDEIQIAAGRSYVRVANPGLAMQPMSQALQEYAVTQPHYEQVHAILTQGADERIQMLA